MERTIQAIEKALDAGVFSNYAAKKEYGNTTTRVLKPEYLMALMLQTYRAKDKDRLIKFLDETEIDCSLLDSILLKYNLKTAFEAFKERYYGT